MNPLTGTPSTNPKIEIHSKATEVHGISAAKLEKAPTTEFILPIFMKWVGASPLVAHNAKYNHSLFLHNIHICFRFDNRLLLQDLTVLKLEKLVDQKPTYAITPSR